MRVIFFLGIFFPEDTTRHVSCLFEQILISLFAVAFN